MNIYTCLNCNKEFQTQYENIETCNVECALAYIKKTFFKTSKRYKVCTIYNKIYEDRSYSIKKLVIRNALILMMVLYLQ